MKERDVDAALETAREVFAGELKIDECIDYIRALLSCPKRRRPVAVVKAVTDTSSTGEVRDISVDIIGDGVTLATGDHLYTDPPLLSDSEFKEYLNRARELMNTAHGTIPLALFLREFEAAVRGEK